MTVPGRGISDRGGRGGIMQVQEEADIVAGPCAHLYCPESPVNGVPMTSIEPLPSIEYDGVHCNLTIRRPASGVAVVVLSGSDIGEFGDLAMRELQKDLGSFSTIELFIDARAVRDATIEVSAEWALWMRAHRTSFKRINMLTGSRYIQITAAFVRRFAGLADLMNVFTDCTAFDEVLSASIVQVRAA